MQLNQQLKEYRLRMGKTQKEIADELKIDKSTYAHYELGRRTPNAKTWLHLAKVLNIPVFPAQIQIEYPNELIDEFEGCLNQYDKLTDNYYDNIQRIDVINNYLNKIFEIRNDAMNVDDLPINELMDYPLEKPCTIMEVYVDMRVENLINKAMKIQSSIIDSMTQNFRKK